MVEYVEGSDIYGHKIQRYRFACIVLNILGLQSGVAGLLDCTSDQGLNQISRQLRIINVVQKFTYTFDDEIESLKKMFSERRASPFDFNQHGFSLLGVSCAPDQ